MIFLYFSSFILLFFFSHEKNFFFTDKSDLLSQLNFTTIDTQVLILFTLQNTYPYLPSKLDLKFLYSLPSSSLINMIDTILPSDITPAVLNPLIIFVPSSESVTHVINKSPFELLVKWTIYFERYLITIDKKSASFGSTVDYVTYYNVSTLRENLIKGVGQYKELSDKEIFEEKIMNIREIPDSLLYYLITQKQKKNLLRQYLINLNNYVSRKNLYYISCYEKNNIFSYDSETLLNIVYNNISQREEFKPLRAISTFIQEIENNNHSFIYFENEIKNIKERKTLEYYARIFNGYDYIIYGGITPFIARLSSEKLISLYKTFVSLYPDQKSQREFSSMSHDQQIKHIIMIINNHGQYKQFEKIKPLIPFKKFTLFSLDSASKADLV